MRYSAGQAAKATGVSTSTITRALKSGKISGERQAEGGWLIDPAELHRVFPPVTPPQSRNPSTPQHETPDLDSRNSGLERLVATLQEQIHDLREDRDGWRAQAERLALLLPAKAPAPVEEAAPSGQRKPVVGFWRRLLGQVPSND